MEKLELEEKKTRINEEILCYDPSVPFYTKQQLINYLLDSLLFVSSSELAEELNEPESYQTNFTAREKRLGLLQYKIKAGNSPNSPTYYTKHPEIAKTIIKIARKHKISPILLRDVIDYYFSDLVQATRQRFVYAKNPINSTRSVKDDFNLSDGMASLVLKAITDVFQTLNLKIKTRRGIKTLELEKKRLRDMLRQNILNEINDAFELGVWINKTLVFNAEITLTKLV